MSERIVREAGVCGGSARVAGTRVAEDQQRYMNLDAAAFCEQLLRDRKHVEDGMPKKDGEAQ